MLCWSTMFFPFPPADMLESNNLVTFEGLANSSAYHTFLLDEEKGRLVVGAKDHIFSFNLLNVSRDHAQVKPAFDSSVSLSGGFIHLSVYHDCRSVCVPDRLKCASPSRVPVRSSGISGLSFLFYTKVPHEYFRPGLLHTITRCARHVRCSLHTWMNNGVNWNKVDNKSHCDLFNPHMYTCMHTSCSCIDSRCNVDPGRGWFFSDI